MLPQGLEGLFRRTRLQNRQLLFQRDDALFEHGDFLALDLKLRYFAFQRCDPGLGFGKGVAVARSLVAAVGLVLGDCHVDIFAQKGAAQRLHFVREGTQRRDVLRGLLALQIDGVLEAILRGLKACILLAQGIRLAGEILKVATFVCQRRVAFGQGLLQPLQVAAVLDDALGLGGKIDGGEGFLLSPQRLHFDVEGVHFRRKNTVLVAELLQFFEEGRIGRTERYFLRWTRRTGGLRENFQELGQLPVGGRELFQEPVLGMGHLGGPGLHGGLKPTDGTVQLAHGRIGGGCLRHGITRYRTGGHLLVLHGLLQAVQFFVGPGQGRSKLLALLQYGQQTG